MPANWLIMALAALGGAGLAVQAPTNAMLGRGLGSPVAAALASFLVGSVALALIVAFSPHKAGAAALRSGPWYAWLGGFYGALFVAVAAFAAPRIGASALLTFAVAGQLVAAVALDHAGALGLARHPASLMRLAGLVLVMGGAVLVERG